MSDGTEELDDDFFEHAIKSTVRKRLRQGRPESGDDFVALRKFLRMTQEEFALALGISVSTLRSWEQGTRWPEGPAIALISIAASHPRIIRQRLREAQAA